MVVELEHTAGAFRHHHFRSALHHGAGAGLAELVGKGGVLEAGNTAAATAGAGFRNIHQPYPRLRGQLGTQGTPGLRVEPEMAGVVHSHEERVFRRHGASFTQGEHGLGKNGSFGRTRLLVMLPEEDGLSILQKLRADKRTEHTQIILLTARGSEYDKVVGLDAGADDYVAKPFGMMELVARVRSALRRAGRDEEPGIAHTLGTLTVDSARHTVQVDGEDISLTLKEFQLLTLLLEHHDTVFTRDQLLSTVWGYDFDGASRTVDVHIRTLRQKLGTAGAYIQTIRGIGYKIGGIV